MSNNEKNNDMDFVKLITAKEQFKVHLIKGVLEDNDIPYITDDLDHSSFLDIFCGGSLIGTNFYVPQDSLEKSKDILTNLFGEEYSQNEDKQL